MKKVIVLFLALFTVANLYAQNKELDSLKLLLSKEKTDTGKINLLIRIGGSYTYGTGMQNDDSCKKYAQQALDLSKKTGYNKGSVRAGLVMVRYYTFTGDYFDALQTSIQVKKQIDEFHDTAEVFNQTLSLMMIHLQIGDNQSALKYGREMLQILKSGVYKDAATIKIYNLQSYLLLGNAYAGLKQPDSTLNYWMLCYENSLKDKIYGMSTVATINIASLYQDQGKDSLANPYYRKTIFYGEKSGRVDLMAGAKVHIAELWYKKGKRDSAFYYTRQALQDIRQTDVPNAKISAYKLLSDLYHQSYQYDSAYKYLQMHDVLQESRFSQEKISKAQNLSFNDAMRQQQVEQAKKDAQQQYNNRLKIYILAAVILIFLIIALLLFRNNQNKRKANLLLSKQKEEIEEQKKNVETTLSELKSTQAQLIQSEKMASLGELTAGIAHEIQNPLNFVNNFSDVNQELLSELKEEADKGNIEDVKAIADDVIANSEKINHHGKRADAIVKGMLQHSRTSTGQKELTDINALADEYLRLSYHGMRAKDKSFNATMKTDFDETIPKINVVPQDIGRVILNLINNAFYAVTEKRRLQTKDLPGFENLEGLQAYEPTVSVTTKNVDNHITITIGDNGNGIPKNIVDKIFQPFFTTKPTGEGTGLGLSLAYDIVKAHGGEIKVNTKVDEGNPDKFGEGAGTEFIIQLLA